MKKIVGVVLLAISFGTHAATKLSCDLDEMDYYTGKITNNTDVRVVVPDVSTSNKNVSKDGEYKTYAQWIINEQASIYLLKGKLDGDLVTLEKSTIEAGTGAVRGEIHHKELDDRPRKKSSYRGTCYLDQ